jgi:monoterpene epsilon-lactone hydrolase
MASWQAHAVDAMLRVMVKRRMRNNTDVASVRQILQSSRLPVPHDVTYAPHWLGGVEGERVEAPSAAPNAPALLYLHGGGYFACSPRTYRPITSWFAKAGFRVFAPAYRLAPEHRFPAAVLDAETAYLALLDAGHAADNTVVVGDSAGGGLALALLLRLRDRKHRLPAAAALFSPWTDLAVTGASIQGNARREAMFWAPGIPAAAAFYLGGADSHTPLASPLYGDLRGLPPLIIHVGDRETLRDDSTRLAERARAACVRTELRVWPVVPHVWQLMHGFVPEARESLHQAAIFLKEAVREAATHAAHDATEPVH